MNCMSGKWVFFLLTEVYKCGKVMRNEKSRYWVRTVRYLLVQNRFFWKLNGHFCHHSFQLKGYCLQEKAFGDFSRSCKHSNTV